MDLFSYNFFKEDFMSNFLKKYGLFLSLAILIGIVSLPTPEGLPVAGHRMLALLVFSVILWMTECVSYPASAAIILSLMVVLLGFSPNVAKPAALLGTGPALSAGLKGFSHFNVGAGRAHMGRPDTKKASVCVRTTRVRAVIV